MSDNPDLQQPASDTAPSARRIRVQRLGRRLGLEPYYAIAEQTDTRLVLQSHPEANARAGRFPMGCGLLLVALMPLLIVALTISGGGDVGATVFGVLVSWPFAAVGYLIWRGGRAVASTANTITVDQTTRTIVYEQYNRVHRPRSQTLHFDQIDHVRLRPRRVGHSRMSNREYDLVVLELITDEQQIWIVDSARNDSPLRPTANALTAVLAVELVDETVSVTRAAAGV